MDISDVEMLSASLVREYLARKRLTQTLSQLDEEQAGLSSCVRNRLQLVRALQIGRLMKRNKQLGTRLDTMLEVIVCFLVRHARKGKVERVEGENIEGDGTEVGGEGKKEEGEGRGRIERRETIVREKVILRKEGEEHGVGEMGREVENIEKTAQSKYERAEENKEELKEIGDGKITALGKQHVSKDNFSKENQFCEDIDRKHEKNKCNQEERQDILVSDERDSDESVDVCKIHKEYAWNKMHGIYLDTGQNIENNTIKEKSEWGSDSKTPLDPRTAYDECENSSTFEMQTENLSNISENVYMQKNIAGDMKELESTSHSPQPLILDSTNIVADSEKSLKDYSHNETDESLTDSDCSLSSVVDLLKDTHDSSYGKLRVIADMFSKGNETSFFIDTCQTKTGVVEKTIKGKSTLKVAWEKDDDDREVDNSEKQKLQRPRRDSDEEIKIKWAMERSMEDTENDQSEEENKKEIETSSEEEAAASGEIAAPSSRPGTQESGPSLWLQEDGEGTHRGEGGGRRSPGVLRIDTQSHHKRSFDDALDTFRSQGSELKNGIVNPSLTHPHLNGHTPNGLVKGRVRQDRSQQGRRSVFDAEPGVDIATMAAQRDQLRGARNVRGMMAPVISKEEESRSRSANRKMQIPRQRSESTLDHHTTAEAHEDSHLAPNEDSNSHGDVLGNMVVGRRSGGRQLLGGLSGVGLRPQGTDYLDSNVRGDIMAQSMRRQSLRGSKQSLLDGLDSVSRASMDGTTPEEYLVYRDDGGEQGYEDGRRKNVPKFIPSSHEDIQILNLQGFMDIGNLDWGGGAGSRRKHKKKRVKRGTETGVLDRAREAYKFTAKPPRRKRTHKSQGSDDDGEMVLRDVDEIDTKVAGLVLGPEKLGGKEPVGRPITLGEAGELRSLLTGSPTQSLPLEWLAQNFTQNSNPNLSYGIVQKKGGPCGVLACVQAYIMKVLVFGSTVVPVPSPVSPLRPSRREWQWALASALTEILWKAGQERRAILATPGPFPSFTDSGTGRWVRDGLTENLLIGEYTSPGLLQQAVTHLLSALTAETGPGCVILLYSLILTRGINNIHTDMDPGGGHLINAHGYSSQEIVNLLLVGRAVTNTFDGERTLGSDQSGESVILKGITGRAEIGMLSLFEHYDCYKVGTHLKIPVYPIWVVCCESHYSCFFSRDATTTSDTPVSHTFDIYYYDGLALQEDEIRLTIDLEGDETEVAIMPPLEHCIRTKWKNAAINWNGTDPIL